MVEYFSRRRNPTQPQILELGNTAQLIGSNFNIELPTKIYAHGWLDSPAAQDYAVRNSYLRHEDCNFFAVDWSVLAQGSYSFVARNSVPIAGEFTGAFIDNLVDFGAPLDSLHLVGFSMGAHVAGIAGNRSTKGTIHRVTGKLTKIYCFRIQAKHNCMKSTLLVMSYLSLYLKMATFFCLCLRGTFEKEIPHREGQTYEKYRYNVWSRIIDSPPFGLTRPRARQLTETRSPDFEESPPPPPKRSISFDSLDFGWICR